LRKQRKSEDSFVKGVEASLDCARASARAPHTSDPSSSNPHFPSGVDDEGDASSSTRAARIAL
jgi:hypothetical protein